MIEQSPSGGQPKPEGTEVTIVVSSFEEPTETPTPTITPTETPTIVPTETPSPGGGEQSEVPPTP